ncbi:hypothetical protein Lal_00043738 [Lupinus albus]|nr:hypothetical protein Lal_00043738 [Lupinus albus]
MVHFRMIGNLPLRAKDMPVEASPSATTFRAERVTLDASARPRDGRNYPLQNRDTYDLDSAWTIFDSVEFPTSPWKNAPACLGKLAGALGGSPMARHPDPPRSSRNIIHKHFPELRPCKVEAFTSMIFNRRAAQSMMP